MAPIVEVELKSGVYPASTEEMRVARCYVCNEIADKSKMVMIGPAINLATEESRLYIYRCKDCTAGSEKWLKHFVKRSPIRSLYMGLEGKTLTPELASAVGKQIVENTKEEYEKAICDRLDKRKVGRPPVEDCVRADAEAAEECNEAKPSRRSTTSTEERGGLSVGRKKRSWRTVTIRRGR